MIRRIAKGLAGLGAVVALTAAVLTPAQAAPPEPDDVGKGEVAARACSVAGTSTLRLIESDGDSAVATTWWVDCGTYKRLTKVRIIGSANVGSIYSNVIYGNPSVYYRNYVSGGTIVNGVDAYATIYLPREWSLGNKICYENCWWSFDGTVNGSGSDQALYASGILS